MAKRKNQTAQAVANAPEMANEEIDAALDGGEAEMPDADPEYAEFLRLQEKFGKSPDAAEVKLFPVVLYFPRPGQKTKFPNGYEAKKFRDEESAEAAKAEGWKTTPAAIKQPKKKAPDPNPEDEE